jgi:large subunit ribosomal protein L3
MALGLLGTKVGMTQVFNTDGSVEPVTVLQVGPCPVLQIRTAERDGYSAVQLGYRDKPRKNATRAEQGHVAAGLKSKRKESRQKAGVQLPPKADVEPQRFVREFRVENPTVTVGQKLTVNDVFAEVKAVDVVGTSKGRGTQGVMRRWNFAGLPAAHGAKKVHRQAGSTASLGSNRGSGRPKKGLKRAGRYGAERVTIRNLAVVRVDPENNLILVRGAVPGHNGSFILVRPTNKFGSRHGIEVVETVKTKVTIQKGKK